jgi:uncharacterized iron-regulated protein
MSGIWKDLREGTPSGVTALCCLVLVLAALPAAASAEIAARPGLIWDVAARAPVTRQALEERLVATDYILLGEKHDNPGHHQLQAEIIQRLVRAGRRPALVWEMLPRSKQGDIDAHLTKENPDPDGFAAAVGWDDLGWGDWEAYRPISAAAMAGRLPHLAGGLDRPDLKAVAQGGLGRLPQDLAAGFVDRDPLSPPQRQLIGDAVYEGHCGFVPRAHLGPMISVQIARDLALADAIARSAPPPGAVLIAGAQHARRDAGAPVHLARMRPQASVLSVGFVEVGRDRRTDPLALARTGAHDFLWFTEPGPDKDYCGDLAKRFGKAHKLKSK